MNGGGEGIQLSGSSRTVLRAATLSLCASLISLSPPAAGEEETSSTPQREPSAAYFSLIIGSNISVDRDLEPLRYADDDAARYFDLFRSLGFRTYLLTRPDENTRRLHPQASAESDLPREAALRRAVEQLSRDLAQARHRGMLTVLYLVYAGHGNLKGGVGYVTLEDGRLDGQRIRSELLERLHADRTHLIVDACHSYYLAYSRGQAGSRRPLQGFSRISDALSDYDVGLLLSSSAAQESHEWEALQAGVFSHEVRSGLHGAADADGDGRVTYREIGAFVERANAAIPNERYRPHVFVRSPAGGSTLLDLRPHRGRLLRIDGSRAGRYLLEDSQGVRLVDFHSAAGQAVELLRPPSAGVLYLRQLNRRIEYQLPHRAGRLQLAALAPQSPRSTTRGAAHHAFNLLFSRPFDTEAVAAFQPRQSADPRPRLVINRDDGQQPAALPAWRRYVGWSALALSAAALGSGVALSLSATALKPDAGPDTSHLQVATINDRIARRNVGAALLYATAGVALAGGVAALLWPSSPANGRVSSRVTLSAAPKGVSLAVGGSY